MGIGYDLHIHSVFSDGTFTPEEIVEEAIWKKLDGVALTDHDTVEGIDRFLIAGKQKRIKVILGIEISASYLGRDIHILGYNYDIEKMKNNEELKKINNSRMPRVLEIINRMAKDGIPVNSEDLYNMDLKGEPGRPHIARILMKKGIVSSWDEAFETYLSEDSPYYVPKYKINVERAIDIILSSNGIPVLAHPGLYRIMPNIEEMVEWGLKGIEVFYPLHAQYQTEEFLLWCKKYNLIATGGSDFHGIESKPPLGSTVVKELPF